MNRRDFMRRMFGVTVTLAVPQLWMPEPGIVFKGISIPFDTVTRAEIFDRMEYSWKLVSLMCDNPRRLRIITGISDD